MGSAERPQAEEGFRVQIRVSGLLAVLSLVSGTAYAAGEIAVPLGPDLAGKGSGRAVAEAVRQALAAAQLTVASDAAVAKAAKASHIKGKSLRPAQGAKLAAKGKFAAVVVYRKGKGGVFAQVVDPHGQVILERMIHVAKSRVVADDATTLATGAAQALGGSAPAPTPANPAPAETPAPAEQPQPAEATAPASPAPAEATAPAAATPAATATEETSQESSEPAAGFLLRAGLFGGAGERLFLSPGFAYTTSSPYLLGGLSLELFPIHSIGLGVIADFAMGFVKDELSGGTGTFTSNDFRGDVALAYRWRLFSSPFGTMLIPRFGVGLRRFDPPGQSDGTQVGIASDNRFFLEGGLQLTQPIVPHYLRLTAGAAALPLAGMSKAGQGFFGDSSAFGLQWMAELGGDLVGGLEWALQVDQERFMDSYSSGPGGAALKDSGVEVETGYTLQVRFHI